MLKLDDVSPTHSSGRLALSAIDASWSFGSSSNELSNRRPIVARERCRGRSRVSRACRNGAARRRPKSANDARSVVLAFDDAVNEAVQQPKQTRASGDSDFVEW